LPKRGFKSQTLKYNGEVNLTDLERLGQDEVDLVMLRLRAWWARWFASSR
jgi:large subunit ribosomal protein L15